MTSSRRFLPRLTARASRRRHRQLAAPAALVLLLWSASGLLHPLMTWTQPRPAASAPPAAASFVVPEALSVSGLADGDGAILAARWLSWQGEPLLRLVTEGAGPRYFHADGRLAAERVETARARWLAAHYAGAEVLADAEAVRDFSAAYPASNRLLPVWRLTTADGRQLYVDTATDRLASLSDARKQRLQSLFLQVHTLDFLEGRVQLRRGLITVLVGGVLLTAALGARLLWTQRGAGGMRRRHRRLALVALLPLAFFAPSGLLHLWTQSPAPAPPRAVENMPLRTPTGAFEQLQWVPSGAAGRWRGLRDGEILHFDAGGRPVAADDAALAGEIALAHGFAVQEALGPVGRFDADYGFINRRLPVWRLRTEAGLVHVDHRSGWLVSVATPWQRLEVRSFALLHKWNLFDRLGRAGRDALMSVAACALLLLAVSGLLLRRRAAKRAAEPRPAPAYTES